MTAAVFDYVAFQRLIEQFCSQLPSILSLHSTTANLAPRVSSLLEAVDTPFTVAVVGQMRVGKSSLLNALVGTDLAVVGVNETTATINWFKYGTAQQCERFRVVWKDRPAEEFPRSEIQHWVGDSERAKATRYIEFFADVEFLCRANVVDTPGTRSVLQAHEDVVQEFLAAKHDAETRRHGGAADAVVYVLMPVARQSDCDLLSDFEQHSRLPGSSPYNSLAVLHKWETLSADAPWSEAQRKAQRIAEAMQDLVSTVIPVSAPLAKAAQFGAEFWQDMHELIACTPTAVLEDLLRMEKYFVEDSAPDCPVDQVHRRHIRTAFPLPWPSFKAIIGIGLAESPSSAMALQSVVDRASGMHLLQQELHRRFFARSQMIKAFSILSKAWEPCQIAASRLRNHKMRFTDLLDGAEQSVSVLEQQIAQGAEHLEPVKAYIDETASLVCEDLRNASTALRELGECVVLIRDAHEDMNRDLRMLELVDKHEHDLGELRTKQLRSLFGYGGPDALARIRPFCKRQGQHAILDALQEAINSARSLRVESRGDLSEIMDHAINRLEQLADWCEEQGVDHLPTIT